eukprot:361103-Chlamydomonas_euryale.AAC.2
MEARSCAALPSNLLLGDGGGWGKGGTAGHFHALGTLPCPWLRFAESGSSAPNPKPSTLNKKAGTTGAACPQRRTAARPPRRDGIARPPQRTVLYCF